MNWTPINVLGHPNSFKKYPKNARSKCVVGCKKQFCRQNPEVLSFLRFIYMHFFSFLGRFFPFSPIMLNVISRDFFSPTALSNPESYWCAFNDTWRPLLWQLTGFRDERELIVTICRRRNFLFK